VLSQNDTDFRSAGHGRAGYCLRVAHRLYR
jgi:hypothetical protein